jgi:hypothetical protein
MLVSCNPTRQLDHKPTQRFPAKNADCIIDRKPPSFPMSQFTISIAKTRDLHQEDAHMVFPVRPPIAEFTNEVSAKPSVYASLFQALETRGFTEVVSMVRDPTLGYTPSPVWEFSDQEHLEGRTPLERDHGDLLHAHD